MSYYSSGTVSLANGATTVTASLTTFNSQARAGDLFMAGGLSEVIAAVTSNTELELASPWAGTSLTASANYKISHISEDWHSNLLVNENIVALIARIDAGIPFQPDAYGTLANRATYDSASPPFFYLQTDVDPFLVYAKLSATSGDWSTGVSFKGLAGSTGATGATGSTGAQGDKGWAPVISVVADGARRVLQVTDWTGGTGTEPAAGSYVGPSGLTSVLADAIDIRGAGGTNGTNGTDGAQGDKGWSPVLTAVTDGARRVFQVSDWAGGAGTKPDTGSYVGAAGLTAVLADAIDVRGPTGATGNTGSTGAQGDAGWSPILAAVNDGSRRVFQVVDWSGGAGGKPATGDYLGPLGWTSTIGDAIDVRGPTGATGSTGATGATGSQGDSGWSPVFSAITDGTRRVLRLTDWVGGAGTKPGTGDYVGATGLTSVLANAVDLRGATGATGATGNTGATGAVGATGSQGDKGWAPVLAVVTDSARRVLQVSDWAGGAGTKPATGDYVGPSGLTSVLASAIDIRGPAGAGTGDVLGPGAAVDGNIVTFNGTSGDSIKDSGVSIDTDAALGANSDSKIPSQKATKAYADSVKSLAVAMAFLF